MSYQTVWLEYHDIEAKAKELGAPPTGTKADGNPLFTCPFMYDPTTGCSISESTTIIEYLDETYPNSPRLIPRGCHALQAAFRATFASYRKLVFPFAVANIYDILPVSSQPTFRRLRENNFGKKLEDVCPRGAKGEEEWGKVKDAFGAMDSWMKREDRFVMGDSLSAADLELAGFIQTCKRVWGDESKEWQDMSNWHGGRWGTLLKSLAEYQIII